jgi:hypothetical protein
MRENDVAQTLSTNKHNILHVCRRCVCAMTVDERDHQGKRGKFEVGRAPMLEMARRVCRRVIIRYFEVDLIDADSSDYNCY